MAKKRPDPDPPPAPAAPPDGDAPPAEPVTANIVEALRPLAVPVEQLVPDPANARTHDERNLDAIRGSLAAYGQRKPVVVNRRTGVVEACNGTPRSPLWRCSRTPSLGRTSERRKEARGAGKKGMHRTRATTRLTAGFEYLGPPRVEDARRLGVV